MMYGSFARHPILTDASAPVVAVLLFAALTGCTRTLVLFPEGDGAVCEGDEHCPPEESCVDGACTTVAVRSIFRSVGPGQNSALATGAGNTLRIDGALAELSGDLPPRAGVGDALVYSTDGGIPTALAFLSRRYSARRWAVQNALGGPPAATDGDTQWSLWRAHVSLADAIANRENTALPIDDRDFDPYTDGTDLIAAGWSWNIACYADAPEVLTDFIEVSSGWTADAAHPLRIFAPRLPSNVGVSQRHRGVFSTDRYHLRRDAEIGNQLVYLSTDGVHLEGLQFWDTATGSGHAVVSVTPERGTVRISASIFRGTANNSAFTSGLFASGDGTFTVLAWNNVFMDFTESAIADNTLGGSATIEAANNTLWGGLYGIQVGDMNVVARNNIIATRNNGGACLLLGGGGSISGSGYNLCNLDEPAIGVGSLSNVTPAFVDSSVGDFHLAPTDTLAIGKGRDLTVDPRLSFTDDLDGEARGTMWDIGADQH